MTSDHTVRRRLWTIRNRLLWTTTSRLPVPSRPSGQSRRGFELQFARESSLGAKATVAADPGAHNNPIISVNCAIYSGPD
jgi:hypothetical protein